MKKIHLVSLCILLCIFSPISICQAPTDNNGVIMQSNINKKISEIHSMVDSYANTLAISSIETNITEISKNKYLLTISMHDKKISKEFDENSLLKINEQDIATIVNSLEAMLNEKPFPRNQP